MDSEASFATRAAKSAATALLFWKKNWISESVYIL